MLYHTAYVFCKLILRLSEEFEITLYDFHLNCLLVTKLLRLKMVNLSDLVGLPLTVTTQEARVEMSFSIAKQIFTQKFESPGFQIEHQIN